MNKKNQFILYILIIFILGGCSTRVTTYDTSYDHHSSHSSYTKSTMRPYTVHGIRYYPTIVHVGETFNGIASWYGPNFHGKFTSNGERYNMYDLTAAHKTLPMNTILRVTNRRNGKSVIVRINDRGPFVNNRIIDLSKAAAIRIGMIATGTAPVRLEVIGFATKNQIPTKKQLKKLPKKYIQQGGFALQIASFSRFQGALKTQQKYNGVDGYTTVIKDVTNNNGRIYKVWLTGFKSEKEARDYKAKGKFKYAFIVRED